MFITNGQSEAHYAAAFGLLKLSMGPAIFGTGDSPLVFMTDDSNAETNALSSQWPQSKLLLCVFHVMQAVWRWFLETKNGVDKLDRQNKINEFRSLVNASSQQEACLLYNEAITSSTGKKYSKWIAYLESYWIRKEKWCKAWRGVENLGQHTNNYSEAAVRIFKDLVLNRCKAYNAVALLEFTVNVLELYYVRRLRAFAHSRNPTLRLLLDMQLKKCSYIQHKDQIILEEEGSNLYLVPSSKDLSMYYEVDTSVGKCTCINGIFGRFCKHEAAVYKFFGDAMPRMPLMTATLKHKIAVLALGSKAEPIEFYDSLKQREERIKTPEVSNSRSCELSSLTVDSPAVYDEADPTAEDDFDPTLITDAILGLHKKFGTNSKGGQKIVDKLHTIKSRSQWDDFIFGGFNPLRYKQGSTIRVQPTSVSRRREGVTRGSKRSAAGRPAIGSSKQLKKRRRCLAHNIANNRANAKSH